MDAVMPSIGGGIMESIPDLTGPAITYNAKTMIGICKRLLLSSMIEH